MLNIGEIHSISFNQLIYLNMGSFNVPLHSEHFPLLFVCKWVLLNKHGIYEYNYKTINFYPP